MHGQAVVVGIGESTYYKHGESPDTEFQLACTAITRAAEDAGLGLNQLDGLISYMDIATVHCGSRPRSASMSCAGRRHRGQAAATTRPPRCTWPTRPCAEATPTMWSGSARWPRASFSASAPARASCRAPLPRASPGACPTV